MSQRVTVFYVKNKPYVNKQGVTVSYPEALIHQHGASLSEGEIGIPLLTVKLSPAVATAFNSTPLCTHNKPIVVDALLTNRQYKYMNEQKIDVILENFTPVTEQK
jgi:hypothetical protein